MKEVHSRLTDEEMEFVDKIKKKYQIKSQSNTVKFIIQNALNEDENPDQKYKDLFDQNEENWSRVFEILDEQTKTIQALISYLTEE